MEWLVGIGVVAGFAFAWWWLYRNALGGDRRNSEGGDYPPFNGFPFS